MVKYQLVSLLPKNLQSYILGKLSRLNWPASMAPTLNKAVAKYLAIDLSDAEKNVGDYRSFEELFTRSLKPDARKVSGEICSPCDSNLRQSLPVDRGELLQAKGIHYSIDDLLCLGEKEKREFKPAWYGSFYLAPHHYHRVHAPFSGALHSVRYVPGELWPVNETFVKIVPKLFCRNERVVFELSHKNGGKAYLVMVGALHVGRIKVKEIDTFVTNAFVRQLRPAKTRAFSFSPPRDIEVGDELGTFMLGSSVIVVFDEVFTKNFGFKRVSKSVPVQCGDSLLISRNTGHPPPSSHS